MTTLKRPALPALTSLRFFAAWAIVVHHCNGVFWPAADLGPLDAGVSFFFVLSGFILTYVYLDPAGGPLKPKDFFIARLARIWPLHLATLLLTIFAVSIPESFDIGVLLANGLMLHAWIPFDRYFFSYNYVSWSISTELFFYLLFPYLLRCRFFSLRGMLALTAILSFALLTVVTLAFFSAAEHLPVWDVQGDPLSSTGLLYTFPPARLAEFLIGMICGMIFMQRQSRATTLTRATVNECLAMLGFAFIFYCFLTAPISLSAPSPSITAQIIALLREWLGHVGLAPFAAIVVYIFAFQQGSLSRCLSHRCLIFLGEISFALYLVHQLTLRVFQQHLHRLAYHFDLPGFCLFVIGVVLLAAMLHLGIERPVRAWLTRRLIAQSG